ncbi:MAG: RluA family pseudouridine synthase [Candidatus Riflebacteria bacterium]|nr:RluA family pseudouridine synthase [Candidatus Riflebacteria bacterium]
MEPCLERPESAPVGGVLEENVYRFEVGPDERRHRLDTYLHRVFKGRSRSYWKRMVERGAVRVPGRPVKGSSRVGQGDRVEIDLELLGRTPLKERLATRKADSPPSYQVIHEDDSIVAVNKRAGAFCHPVGRLHNRSVISDIRRDRGRDGLAIRPCHRLDRFVSGLLVMAKSREAAGQLGAQFEGRDVEKAYLALVHGEVPHDQGRISIPVGKAANSVIRIRMGPDPDGKPSVTRYAVLRRLPGHTLLLLEPETGRRHQLRLHLSEIGHPIVNDPLYGPKIDVDYYERQTFDNHDDPDDARRWIALHSYRLTFDHPSTGVRMTLEAPPWGAFEALLGDLERGSLPAPKEIP